MDFPGNFSGGIRSFRNGLVGGRHPFHNLSAGKTALVILFVTMHVGNWAKRSALSGGEICPPIGQDMPPSPP